MLTFVIRRIIAAFFIVLGATFIAYILMANAGDPLETARGTQNVTQRLQQIKSVTAALHLDINPVARYFLWLKGIGGCFVGKCDFGTYINLQSVTSDLGTYMVISLRLITAATVLAIFFGIAIGIVTAIKQYSGFDYTITFTTFVFFSLPVFWIGILLKDLVAIKFNDFLNLSGGPTFSTVWFVVLALFFALVTYSILNGTFARKIGIAAIVAVVVFALAFYISQTHWLLHPSLGLPVIAVLSILLAFGVTTLTTGVRNRQALLTALITAVIGIVLWYPLQIFFHSGMSFWKLILLLVIGLVVGIVTGYLVGGDDKRVNARTGALTAFAVAVVIFIDRIMRTWKVYSRLVGGRPLATQGQQTPNLNGDFWINLTDVATHLLLPTITLMIISLATHSRFARSSMLEVLNQDYIRTARAKGLTERTVIMRHAFRNSLIPITTIIAFDISGLLGGAVLTETVFSYKAMGQLFQQGLLKHDPNPVMAFFLVNAVIVVIMNMVADIAYALLDPRIRVGSS
ncbi:MAG: ABC transporter permease [Actinomycetota bacterium]|nr:ABC transporter permease [Actinomycetota bacterium]